MFIVGLRLSSLPLTFIMREGVETQILEAEICMKPSSVTFRHFNKNPTIFLLGDGQKTRKYIPWSSAHSKSLFINVVLGLLHRICFNTAMDSIRSLAWPWKAYVVEIKTLCYPRSIIKEAVAKFLCLCRIPDYNSIWTADS
jgi:hypothetical protein